jgi:hypothetical protein
MNSWKAALDHISVQHAEPPSFIPADAPALVVLGYGGIGGTIVFVNPHDVSRYGTMSLSAGYGCATAFEIEDPEDLVEVLEEWGRVD